MIWQEYANSSLNPHVNNAPASDVLVWCEPYDWDRVNDWREECKFVRFFIKEQFQMDGSKIKTTCEGHGR